MLQVPPAALLSVIQKGLEYTEAEINVGADGEKFSKFFGCFCGLTIIYIYIKNLTIFRQRTKNDRKVESPSQPESH